jgi:hypothetical protein
VVSPNTPGGQTPSTTDTSSVAPTNDEVMSWMVRLQNQVAADAVGETMASNTSGTGHRTSMTIIGNMKA